MPIEPYDSTSYALIVQLIDAAEDRAIRRGLCRANEADAFVTAHYIYWAAGLVHGASVYLPNDERIGADAFLSFLPAASTKLRSVKRRAACVKLLSQQPHIFFPMFGPILRGMLRDELRKPYIRGELRHSGIVLLAAASLPEAQAEIRRELRRRGEREPLLVRDKDMERRLIKDDRPFALADYSIKRRSVLRGRLDRTGT